MVESAFMRAGAILLNVFAGFAALMVVLVLAVVLFLGVSASTPPITDADGNDIPGSIALLEKLELGGLDQWISIRGVDATNPVLLWLHGGPGSAQMPLAHHLDGALEEEFVVVHWDQRGAGKSNHGGFDESTMRFEQFLEDAVELIEHLRRRFGQDTIVLLGHSWGTQLGVELIRAYPEYFRAYVAVSQVVNHERATEVARDWLARTIEPNAAPDDWRRLVEIEIPARRHAEYRKLNRLVDHYSGSFDLSIEQLVRIVVRAPEYTVLDYVRYLRGMNRGGGPMHERGMMAGYDFVESIPTVDVPVFFFTGANDYNTPLALVREYYEIIDAPHKELVVFEHSAHLPFLAETEKFNREVILAAARRSADADVAHGDAATPRDR